MVATTNGRQRAAYALMLIIASTTHIFSPTYSFSLASSRVSIARPPSRSLRPIIAVRLRGGTNDGGTESSTPASMVDSDAILLGTVGMLASSIMLYSESVLLRTGCGLPAGPYGLFGAAEGLSYLGVLVLVGLSLFTKIRTGTGLPPGPGGILGAAEGVSYLALLAGMVVLFAQVTNYGYIPNAIPTEGGMCS
ncbi:hypothetical protein ACHAXA_001517 [Cyclostephanos tholiformis]|uniref:NADH dehydrogenase subunit 6 n=1 Tax=Cyclostephanos tholiformis TaxID=382380 RepID=A0ABD3RX14_9STRA